MTVMTAAVGLFAAAGIFWVGGEAANALARRLVAHGIRPGRDMGEVFREAAPMFRLGRAFETVGALLLAAAAGVLATLPLGAP